MRSLRVAGCSRACWVLSCLLGALVAAAALAALTIGILATAGKTAYPVDVGIGPLRVSQELSMPVAWRAPVCDTARTDASVAPEGCVVLFVHNGDRRPSGAVKAGSDQSHIGSQFERQQDADVRPREVSLTGAASLEMDDGPNALGAFTTAGTVIGLGLMAAFLIQLGLVLVQVAAASPTRPIGSRLRVMGWLLVLMGAVDSVQSFGASPTSWGYSVEVFGPGIHLSPSNSGSVELLPIAVGLVLVGVGRALRRGGVDLAADRV